MPCTLEYTDKRFIYAEKSYPGVPLLVNPNFSFVAPVCDYLRHLVIHLQLALSSVKTYAEYIQHFWNFLEEQGIEYTEVTDNKLLTWLNRMENKGNKDYVTAQRCDAVFDLFCWLEISGYVHGMVLIPGHNNDQKIVPMLSSKKARPSRYRSSRYGIVSAIRPSEKDAYNVQPTPTAEDMTKIYIVADKLENLDLTDRNHLLIDWYAQVGLRRLEVRHLTVDQIPEWAEIDRLRQLSNAYELRLEITKGGKSRHVGVLPHLLEKTREYIEGPRAKIVKRFQKKRGNAYNEPKELFLSDKTGLVLALKPISNLFTSFFGEANVDGHGHRIRAYYLQKLVEAETDAAMASLVEHGGSAAGIDWELIIRKVAERAGHHNIETIRRYVTFIKKKYGRMAGRDDLVIAKQMLAATKYELAIIEHRLAEKKAELDILNTKVCQMNEIG